jgi:hypothetical protein
MGACEGDDSCSLRYWRRWLAVDRIKDREAFEQKFDSDSSINHWAATQRPFAS